MTDPLARERSGREVDSGSPAVHGFYDEKTGSTAYVLTDPATRQAAIIDPVLNYNEADAATSTAAADEILAFVEQQGLEVTWILETHPHADHLSAGGYLRDRLGAPMAIGAGVVAVQRLWTSIYNLGDEVPSDGSQWDRLWRDGDSFPLGELRVRVMESPGHTPASVTYIAGDAAFVHDTLFMPDFGTARCDFPGGDARQLYRSIQAILSLPEETRLFTGHDYRPGGRPARWETTVAEQKRDNVHLKACPSEEAFAEMRQARDAGLGLPALMLAALQVNIRGGRLPEAEANGTAYLKIPLNRF